jgi:hypothetical protein
VELAFLLGLLVTSAAVLGAPGKGWLAGVIVLGVFLLAAFLVVITLRRCGAQRGGAVVVVAAGQVIPADGEIVGGVAIIDEGVITGVSGGVLREAHTDRSAVLGGTLVLAGRILVRTTTGSRSLVRL